MSKLNLFTLLPALLFLLLASCKPDYQVHTGFPVHVYMDGGAPVDWSSVLSPSFCDDAGVALVGAVHVYDADGSELFRSPDDAEVLTGGVASGSAGHIERNFLATVLPTDEASLSFGIATDAPRPEAVALAHERELATAYPPPIFVLYPANSSLSGDAPTGMTRVFGSDQLSAALAAARCGVEDDATARVFVLPEVRPGGGALPVAPPTPSLGSEPNEREREVVDVTPEPDRGASHGRAVPPAGCANAVLMRVATERDPLNVRARPSLRAEVIGKLSRGQEVEVCLVDRNPSMSSGREYAWQEVSIGGRTGYVFDRYLRG